jgi:hypothetical protein
MWRFAILMLLNCGYAFGQNLVPNPGFENTSPFCYAFAKGDLEKTTESWTSPTLGDPDIYHTKLLPACPNYALGSTNGYSFGKEQPAEGNAMAAIMVYCASCATETREYLQVVLNEPMMPGQTYAASMKISRAERSKYAVDKLGMLFSETAPSSGDWKCLPFKPQIEYPGTIFNDTGWLQLSGMISPTRILKYLTIGNFKNDLETTVSIMNMNLIHSAVYFIDEVSVTLSPVGIKEMDGISEIMASPNPVSEKLTIKGVSGTNYSIHIKDLWGRPVLTKDFITSSEINTDELQPGTYFYSVFKGQRPVRIEKFIKF